jgi:hypothetical protein
MNIASKEAAHQAWVKVYRTRGPAITHYAEFIRGFNEGVVASLEQYLAVHPIERVVPKVPTIDTLRLMFEAQDRDELTRFQHLKKFLGVI